MRKSYLLSDMGFKPASEIEPPADRRVAHRKTPTVSRNSRAIAKAITIDKARKAYDALTDKQKKALGDEFLGELSKAEEQIGKLEKEAPEDYKKAVKEAQKLKVTGVKAKAKKIYYVQIRTCKKVTNKATGKTEIFYGSWSKTARFKAAK